MLLNRTYTFILTLGILFGIAASLTAQVQRPQQQQAPQMPEPIEPSSITDKEIDKIVDITDEADTIQRESQKKVKALVDSSAISYERYVQIIQASQNPQQMKNLNLTEDERNELGKLQPKLMQINQQSQQQFIAIIEDNGMEIKRFQQIMMAAQKHQEVSERIEEERNSDS